MRLLQVVVLCTLLATPATFYAQSKRDSLIIRDGRVGLVVVGISIDSLYHVVDRAQTRLVDRHGEGMFDPVIEIGRSAATNRPALVVEVSSAGCGHVVGRIWVYDPHFETESGLRVGSTLSELRQQHRVIVSREEGLHAISTDPAFTFDLSGEQATSRVTAILVRWRGDLCGMRK